jgi:hypothetical protein
MPADLWRSPRAEARIRVEPPGAPPEVPAANGERRPLTQALQALAHHRQAADAARRERLQFTLGMGIFASPRRRGARPKRSGGSCMTSPSPVFARLKYGRFKYRGPGRDRLKEKFGSALTLD